MSSEAVTEPVVSTVEPKDEEMDVQEPEPIPDKKPDEMKPTLVEISTEPSAPAPEEEIKDDTNEKMEDAPAAGDGSDIVGENGIKSDEISNSNQGESNETEDATIQPADSSQPPSNAEISAEAAKADRPKIGPLPIGINQGRKSKAETVATCTRTYLDATIVPALLQALTALVKERPQRPIEYIAGFLMKNRHRFEK
ncbi:hypothetical protein SNEBB_011163 [Seison nebaliae]|nr:hypothetical protein SNEBB_011163 [Seison nebaliae]